MQYLKQILQHTEQVLVGEIIVDCSISNSIYEICKKYGNDIFLVADENTAELLNKNILNRIPHLIISSISSLIERDTRICAMQNRKKMTLNRVSSLETVNLVRRKSKNSDLIVAFGSGTVNDICKYASYLERKDYISFPTAASMNGYSSANASILVNGHKKSFIAHLPKAIYIDTNIITNAPLRLTLSGFADFMCRSTVQADWLLSHLLLGTKYNEFPFKFVHNLEKVLLREYSELRKKNKMVILFLMEVLLVSGLGMVMSEGSYSASQGEHMIAHAMEMITSDFFSLHGEKIAVATITMASLQEKILSVRNPIIKSFALDIKNIDHYFHKNEFLKILGRKQALQQKVQSILDKEWDKISCLIKQNLLSARYLQKVFKDLSIPYLPEHLCWKKEEYYRVVDLAFITRDRFTFLDLDIEES